MWKTILFYIRRLHQSLAVTVVPEEASHQAALTLVTSVGLAQIKTYRKGKKSDSVTWVRERDMMWNTGHTAMAPNQNNLPQGCSWLINNEAHPPFTRIFSAWGDPKLKLNVSSYANKMWPVMNTKCDMIYHMISRKHLLLGPPATRVRFAFNFYYARLLILSD